MKKKTCRLLGIAVATAALILVSGQVWADQIVAKAADASVAFRVYNGYTGTLTIAVTGVGTNIAVTCDGLETTIDGNLVTSNSDVTAAIAACTNTSGTASLRVDANPSLAADVLKAKISTATYTALAGKWLEVLWDTSAALHYDLYFPDRSYQAGVGAYTLASVNCVPTGTGNVTASIYKSGVLVMQKVVTSPVYVNPATWVSPYGDTGAVSSVTNSYTADANVTVDWAVDLPFTGSEPVIVRVARATTATTGNIGAVIK